MSKLKLRLVLADDEANPTKLMMMLEDMMRYVKGEVRVESLSVLSAVHTLMFSDFTTVLAFIKQGQDRGCSDKDLVDKIGISPEHMSRIKDDHAPLTEEVAIKVEEVMAEMGIDTFSTSDTAAGSE